jgi:hypothetical protein
MPVTAIKQMSEFVGVLTLVAPTGGVTVKVPVKIGAVVVVPLETAAAGVSFQGQVIVARSSKVLNSATKVAGTAWTTGLALYFHPTNGFQTTATGATAGFAAAAAAASAATVGDVIAIGS